MRYMKQLSIILMISFIGEILKYFIPLPISASIYGLVLMLLALHFRIIKLSSVRDVGKFLIEIMPLMFIPSSVGLITTWDILHDNFIPVMVIIIVSTILVMSITGSVTQWVITRKGDDILERDAK